MPILEDLKEYMERATGLRRPGKADAPDFVRKRKPHTVRLKDDGLVPNHPRWPLIPSEPGNSTWKNQRI